MARTRRARSSAIDRSSRPILPAPACLGHAAPVDPLAPRRRAALQAVADALAAVGANLTLAAPGERPLPVGAQPELARVSFRDGGAIDALARARPSGARRGVSRRARRRRWRHAGGDQGHRGARRSTSRGSGGCASQRRSRCAAGARSPASRWRSTTTVPPEFFLPWFERWRSYSHGLYATPDDDPSAAQARKLQSAIDALGLRPGMRVLDVGAGWGSFVEYAGLQGIRVHGLTISREQHRFVAGVDPRARAAVHGRAGGLLRLPAGRAFRRRRLHGQLRARARLSPTRRASSPRTCARARASRPTSARPARWSRGAAAASCASGSGRAP